MRMRARFWARLWVRLRAEVLPVWAAGMIPAERNCAPLNLRMKLTSLG